jgi:hypothetical protein
MQLPRTPRDRAAKCGQTRGGIAAGGAAIR